ncbi:MAG: M20/M25/M40 family metallo-hydrolase [Acidobacteria bacterium]|nr:M20/M25/M40 family metallo-hydrolase [Acidobacteriota bacterium]
MAVVLALLLTLCPASTRAQASGPFPFAGLRERSVRAHLEFLAADALRGRGSGSRDELVAATYVAAQLRQYGLQPLGEEGGYLQTVELSRRELAAPPHLVFQSPAPEARETRWKHGSEIVVMNLASERVSGPLQKLDATAPNPEPVQPGAIVFFKPVSDASLFEQTMAQVRAGAAAVLVAETPRIRSNWNALGAHPPDLPGHVKGSKPGMSWTGVALTTEAAATIEALPDGTEIRLEAPLKPQQPAYTWNVVGSIPGRDPLLKQQAILLSAHLDHVGEGKPVNGDSIYNGADDDASGVAAVLELARALSSGPKPRRTVLFAFFGSEESGGLGSKYLREHPPLPLAQIVANLQFEMIGRPDPKVPPRTLWLTGYERSDLGPQLAAHGARLVADPHPDHDFFRRSDNYVLAKEGVVAHTVSSYGLHKQYHQPDDEIGLIDFAHMVDVITSMIAPVRWLANSPFVPQWKPGKKP